MTVHENRDSDFERRTRAVLEKSLTRVPGRIRWRLVQARREALGQGTRSPRSLWSHFALLPAAGTVAAVVLVAVMLWIDRPEQRPAPTGEAVQATLEDIDLFVDSETLELIEGWESGFYEWAVAQAEQNGEASG